MPLHEVGSGINLINRNVSVSSTHMTYWGVTKRDWFLKTETTFLDSRFHLSKRLFSCDTRGCLCRQQNERRLGTASCF